jgi:two-component system, NtrC family, sensor kinase
MAKRGQAVRGPPTRRKVPTKPKGAPADVNLKKENAALRRELAEALERQTATSEVLQVISSTPGDLDPVFQSLLENATRVCGAKFGIMQLLEGDIATRVALYNVPLVYAEALGTRTFRPHPESPLSLVISTKQVVHTADVRTNPAYLEGNPAIVALSDLGGARTLVAVPMLKDAKLLGTIGVYRQEVRPFTDKQIELLGNFANQAVIAIENARLFNETEEALARQTATADVLKVIASSPSTLQPVFNAIAERSKTLIGAHSSTVIRYVDGMMELASFTPVNPEADATVRKMFPRRPTAGDPPEQILRGEVAQITDAESEIPVMRDAARARGWRSRLLVPLKDDGVIGWISVTRKEPGGFADKDVELLRTFADQAVIAIKNVKLFEEVQARTSDLQESLQQQTATADVLKVISRSTVDLETVLNTLAETVTRLCRADYSTMYRRHDDKYHLVTAYGALEEVKEFVRTHPFIPDRGTLTGRVGLERRVVHIPDVLSDPEYTYHELQKIAGYRSMLGIPLLRSDELIGIFGVHRTRVEPFTDKEIELASTFADQAVIAIENARLLDEIRHRNDELAEALEFQTATGEVLRIVASSPNHLQPVFDAMLEKATELCDAKFGMLWLYGGGAFTVVADRNLPPAYARAVRGRSFSPETNTALRFLVEGKAPVHIRDAVGDGAYADREPLRVEAVELGGVRSFVAVPMLKKGELIGLFSIYRDELGGFAENQIALVTTFADQAVIAIENARLFDELRDRQAELRVTFDNMGDGVVMFGADTRLVAWNRNFQEILDLPDAFLAQRPSFADYFHYLAKRGEYSADLEAELSRTLDDTSRVLRLERTRPDGRVIEARQNPVPGGGFVLIYADITERKQAEEAIRAARDAAEKALRELQTAQASLVHAQKMAALGQLTAGIAHEIKNPLNFVNNFSALSAELTDELNGVLKPAPLADKMREEVAELTRLLKENLEKVVQHGRRADSIVKNMLLHSREGTGERRSADINALVEESLNLAYHGARAEKQGFNITLKRSLDPNAGEIDVFPQEITRVILNLISNGFYAATKRKALVDGDGYEPTLVAATKNLGDRVEISIRDSGTGIPPEVKEKMFNPFFTTKPAGEGTGLGLSLSYDIVVKQHGGSIEVDTQPGEFTEFRVILPRMAATGKAGADK